MGDGGGLRPHSLGGPLSTTPHYLGDLQGSLRVLILELLEASMAHFPNLLKKTKIGHDSLCLFGWISPLFSLLSGKSFLASCLSGKGKIFLRPRPLLVIEMPVITDSQTCLSS